jgi:hypothetical protein
MNQGETEGNVDGARLNASQVQMLNASVTDPRAKAIIQRTAGK